MPTRMRDSAYYLRNTVGTLTRRKRIFKGSSAFQQSKVSPSDSRNVRYPAAKRIRRSDSVSSQKENHPVAKRSSLPTLVRSYPLRNLNPLNSLTEGSAVTSTPNQRQSAFIKLIAQREKKNRAQYTPPRNFKGIQISPKTRRVGRSRRKQSSPSAELCIKITRADYTDNTETDDSSRTSPSVLDISHPSQISWLSPRHFGNVNKDQAAKLKRLNARKIEFDLQELSQSLDQTAGNVTTESLLNQSIVGDPLEKLMGLCGQNEVKSFDEYLDEDSIEGIVKIGEGVYGEVFQSPKGHVIKIFPVDGEEFVNGEKQMTFAEVYPEVFVSKKLSELSYKYRLNRSVNFAQLKKATIVQGSLPEAFASSWKKYENQHGSDNECPSFLPPHQQWMILEFEYAGEPLANVKFNTCREARSVIEQIALSLAAAESALQFEHRDLHWHNILVRPTRQWKLRYRVDGVSYAVFTEGIQVTIIDFTVSRLCHEGNIVYVDMADSPEIFECEGDYQFDIYRIMRDHNGNDWRPFHPISNIYWLHYLMGKLLNETSYPRRDPDSQPVESELRALYDMVLTSNYKSALELVTSSFYFDPCRIG